MITSSNELSRPDGSLSKADNVIIDFDNTIQQRKGFKEYSQVFGTSPKQLLTYKSKVITHYDKSLSFDSDNNGTFSNFTGDYSELVPGLRIKSLEANGNCYFTTSEGIKKISVKDTSELATAEIVNAGAAEAIDLSGKLIPDASGFLPAQSKVAYRLLFGYRDANTNLLRGVPSSRTLLTNNSKDVNTSEIFSYDIIDWTAFPATGTASYMLFSTIDSGYFFWFKRGASQTAPITDMTLDRTPIEVDITSADTATTSNEEIAAILGNTLASQVTGITVAITGKEVEITVNEPGDAVDAAGGNIPEWVVKITKTFDGSIVAGSPAYAKLSFTLPPEVDETYFYQIYRTGVVTISAGVTLNDIDPGDEHYFVYEAPVTATDLAAGEITIEDNTPEAFRQAGAYLYTNAITGEGITQANERPPISQDVALFRNSTFYSNTKEFHRTTFTMLSVDDFVSSSTKFYIGRGSDIVEYTFVGVPEVTDITVASATGTTENTYIELNAANDERQYYIWFDKGTGVDPAIVGKLGIRVPLQLYPDTVDGSKQALLDSLLGVLDFNAADFSINTIRITCTDAGQVTPPAGSATPSGWTFAVVTTGDGEDILAKEVLLSQSSSVGVAIDLTARSLVRVINRDVDSPVTARYLSGVDDLPGQILLKAKSLQDVDFYIAISDSTLSAEFSPEVPVKVTLDSISSGVFTTTTAHNLVVGDEVYVNDNIAIGGAYKVATVVSVTQFTLTGTFTNQVGPLSGYIFKTTAASDNNETPNRVYYSKISQPEAVPTVNYIDIGSKDKNILRILALRDNLFVLKEDGIFIVTGASAGNFSVRLLDNSAILTAPDTAVVLNNLIYCLSTQGVISISDSGVSIVSRQIEDLIKKVTTFNYNFKYTSFGVSYESDRAYILWLPTNKTDTVATQCFRYSTITNTWTRWTVPSTCGIVNYLGDDRMYLGGTGRNFILQERKNGERADYSDRDFVRSIGADSVIEKKIVLSSGQDVEVGDVIVQEQYLSVPKLNRFLKKLDSDPSPEFNDYFTTLEVGQGSNLANTLIELVNKMNLDLNLATFTVPSGLNTLEQLKLDFNTLVNEINITTSGTTYKDYKTVSELQNYEVLIKEKVKNSNTVTVDRSTWFIQGDVTIYKAIQTEVRWAPQHFGEPEKLKQIHEGTVIFDQGTISNGVVGYASDRSQDFSEINFTMDGPGFWACFDWMKVPWGGQSNEVPVRTLIPQNKSRCRYLHVQFKHSNAREQYKLLGISLEPREISTRAYR